MKVILTQTVPKLGKEGQVVNVADGYARNFLFQRKLAILADKNQLVALERKAVKLKALGAETLSAAETDREKLEGKTVRIEGKVGKDTGRLFGAVTSQDIADAIKAQLGYTIEKKRIGLVHPIKQLGFTVVQLDLHNEVDANLTVEVFDPEAAAAAAAKAKADDEAAAAETPELVSSEA